MPKCYHRTVNAFNSTVNHSTDHLHAPPAHLRYSPHEKKPVCTTSACHPISAVGTRIGRSMMGRQVVTAVDDILYLSQVIETSGHLKYAEVFLVTSYINLK